MNSNNKYRAWDEHTKQFIDYNVLCLTKEGFGYAKPLGYSNMSNPEHIKLMQYTGYNDKNNREVYEEDSIPYHFNESIIGIVKYGRYSNCFDKTDCDHIGFYVDWQDESFRKDLGYWLEVSEVVGNTYEGLRNKINEVK